MGLLDEAIREHLELKRRRGADPAAVARAEREALGPGVRAATEAAPTAVQATGNATGVLTGAAVAEPTVPAVDPVAPAEAVELAPVAEAEPEPVAPSEPAPAEAPDSPPWQEQPTEMFDAESIFADD